MSLQVEGTNDSSCLSKCSTAKQNYFNDEFLSSFVNKCPRRAPLIHLGYSIRAVIINNLVEEFVEAEGEKKQIVSLGAGFDTLYYKLKKKNPSLNLVYFELDLPRVVQRKIVCIKKSDLLCQIVGEFTESHAGLMSEDYKLINTDLRDVKAFEETLQTFGLDPNLPTMFLSECAITYLEEDKSSELIKFTSRLEHATFVTYEQIHPEDGFGLVMVRHFASLKSPLLSVAKHPTLEHQIQRYINHNWDQCTSISAMDAYNEILTEEERARVLRLEPFDEWEELYLKCVHYAVTIASKGSLSNWSKLSLTPVSNIGLLRKKYLHWELFESKNTCRYGHSVVRLNNNLLIIGGFGVRKDRTHGRMKSITWLECTDHKLNVSQEMETSKYSTMYSSWTPMSNDTYIVYGGRTAPTNSVMDIPEMVTFTSNGGLTSTPLVECCEMPPRWRHTAVIVKIDDIDTFLVFGGRTTHLELLNDTWMVPLHPDPTQRRVKLLAHQKVVPCPRFSHSTSVRQTNSGYDEVWVFGGLGSQGPLGDLWCLDLTTEEWTEVMVTCAVPRFGHTALLEGHCLVVVGGVNGHDSCQPGITVVNLLSGKCVEYSLPVMSPEKSMLLINHCHVFYPETRKLCIIGGGGNCFSFGTFFNSHCAVISLENLSL